jgi:hypothetical protein
VSTLECTDLLSNFLFELMMDITGDTLTYTLGAMKPETAGASVITADADAKQLALNKVSGCC